MEAWEQWLAMARESQRAGLEMSDRDALRSSVSRFYYAAYQAVSAVLLYSGQTPPVGSEAWSHAVTPEMIEPQLGSVVSSRDERQRIARQLRELYKLRIVADYRGQVPIEKSDVVIARKAAAYVVKIVEVALIRGRS